MDQLKEMIHKLIEYHNKIAEMSNNRKMIDDEFASEVADYLSNDVPSILLNADKIEAHKCVIAICKRFPNLFLVNVLTALVLYIFGERAGINQHNDDDPDAPIDTNILLTDRK